jgi:phosphate uptake regulator
MKRKLIKQGQRSVTVSLPNKWVERYGLKPKDEIELVEQGSQIVIRTDSETRNHKISLDVRGMPSRVIERYLIAAYKTGADEIEVRFSDEAEELAKHVMLPTIQVIQDSVNDFLIGVDIVELKQDYCKIKQISHIAPEDFQIILRRIFLLIMSQGENALLSALRKGSVEIVKGQHNNIERLANYSTRMLNKQPLSKNTQHYYLIIQQLEEISDVYFHTVAEADRDKTILTEKVAEMFEKVNGVVRTFYEFFYGLDSWKGAKVYIDRRIIFEDVERLKRTGDAKNNTLLSRLAVILIILFNLVEARISMLE